ncbi:MAG: helix-turn-helix transcriptional regulator [Henriciella sp.]
MDYELRRKHYLSEMERTIEARLDAIETALTARVRRYLTSDEAAERCRVSTSTMERLRATGDGPRFARIGGRVIYDAEDIAEWVDAKKELRV